MNKKDDCRGLREGGASSSKSKPGRRAASGRQSKLKGTKPGQGLARDQSRLLGLLASPDAFAFVDPNDDAVVIVRQAKAGTSTSGGSFSRQSAEALVRQDLARWEPGARLALVASSVGRAFLRREASAATETAFFDQHRDTASLALDTPEGTRRVRVDLDESPLDWLRRRKGPDGQRLISEAAYEAGKRLRRDLMQAGLMPSVTARWDATPTGSGAGSPSEATDRMVAARQRVRHAFDAIGGDFGDLLLDLCGFLKGLEIIERERHWPARSGKVVLRLALNRLAAHYGIETSAHGPSASRGIRAWQAVVIEGGLR